MWLTVTFETFELTTVIVGERWKGRQLAYTALHFQVVIKLCIRGV